MPKEYVAIDSDTWQTPKLNGYLVACCDCGLVHEMDFQIKDGVIQYRVRRNNQATAAKRRHMPKLTNFDRMLEALENLENDDNSIPEHAWKLVTDAIKKARGGA